MNRCSIVKWVITGVVAAAAATVAHLPAVAAHARDLPFRPGEKITYDLVGQIKEWRLKGTLGEMEVVLIGNEVFRGQHVLHAQATLSSSLLLKTRLELKGVFHTWFDPRTFQTHRVEKIIREGSESSHILYEIDHKKNIVTEHNRKSQKVRTYAGPSGAYDFLSFLYWFRTARKEQPFTFTLFDGEWRKEFTVAPAPGEDVSMPHLDRKNKIKTLLIKQSAPYDLSFRYAKDFRYIPIEMSAINVKARDVHFTARGILSGYQPGK